MMTSHLYQQLQVNVDNNEITSKDTPEHQNKDNNQENISLCYQSQNAPLNEKETSKKITMRKKLITRL